MKCAHDVCECDVSAGDAYCSTHCEDADKSQHSAEEIESDELGLEAGGDTACQCGHSACENALA
jgi:hypothetical protein